MKQKNGYSLQEELAQSKIIIDRFVRSCSHDLRGPLASIQGLAAVARHTHSADLNYCLDLIQCCVKNMKEIICNLEAYMTHSQRELSCDELDACKIVETILGHYEPAIKNNNVRIVTHIDQRHAWISDYECNFLILKHVIGNAIQFTDQKKKVKQIDIHGQSTKKGMLITVRDNGIGIGRNQEKLICQPFFRGSLQSHGGLGLFLVKTLTEKLGAELSIHSKEQEGTTCAVIVPNLKKAS